MHAHVRVAIPQHIQQPVSRVYVRVSQRDEVGCNGELNPGLLGYDVQPASRRGRSDMAGHAGWRPLCGEDQGKCKQYVQQQQAQSRHGS